MKLDAFKLDYKPALPPKHDYGIAIVGCGCITSTAHLPVYRKHNLNIVGCFDAKRDTAESFARQFSIPKTYASIDELFDDKKAQIVDIAVPAKEQRKIVE